MAGILHPPQISPATIKLNVADRLSHMAARMPDAIAVACPVRQSPKYAGRFRGKSGVGSERDGTGSAEEHKRNSGSSAFNERISQRELGISIVVSFLTALTALGSSL